MELISTKLTHHFARLQQLFSVSGARHPGEYPMESYRFTQNDAARIYDLVLEGNLHHSNGEEVALLEKEFAAYHRSRYAFATTTGTAALVLALLAVQIKPGDEVVIPAYTNLATAQAVLSAGGIPVFADIDETFTLSPSSVSSCITKRTRAVIPVHIFGNMADMPAIMSIAKKHRLFVIEDCCQATGALMRNKRAGTFGHIGCHSFSAKKAIFTGEGGILTTSDASIEKRLIHFRSQTRNLYTAKGAAITSLVHTYNMTQLQAALARTILSTLDSLQAMRRKNYNLFTTLVRTMDIPVTLPATQKGSKSALTRIAFTIDFNKVHMTRHTFLQRARDLDIPLRTFYPQPIYSYALFQQRQDRMTGSSFPFFLNTRRSYTKLHLPNVEAFCTRMVGMNFSPYLTTHHIRYLAASLHNILANNRET